MAEHSHIEWTDATWNPITGCSVVSPGCTNCYAMKLAGTRLKHHPSRAGLTVESKAGPVWTGEVRLNEGWLDQPLRWAKPRRIFVCAHGDLFHEDVPDAWIDQVFARMALSKRHTYQVLTKRAARMRAYIAGGAAERVWRIATTNPVLSTPGMQWDGGEPWPLPNVWLGVSAEDQARADERIPDLLFTLAAVRFVSLEPLLGPIDLTDVPAPNCGVPDDEGDWRCDALTAGEYYWFRDGDYTEGGDGPDRPALDLVIVGGESGPRPMHPDWVRDIRDDCAEAGVAFFFKQWGSWTPGENVSRQQGWVPTASWFDGRWDYDEENLADCDGHIDDEPDLYKVGKKAAGRLLDGVTHDAMPGASHG